MSSLPKRNVLISILQDAIDDRGEMLGGLISDTEDYAETQNILAKYRHLSEKLEDAKSVMGEDDKDTLALACLHARIWRESYYDAWAGTGEKAILHGIKNDIAKIGRVERAIGRRFRLAYEKEINEAENVNIEDLRKARAA